MKKVVSILACMLVGIVSMSAQIRFSATANVYNHNNNQKIGAQYIAANIGSNGEGTMTIGSLTMRATITKTQRNNAYNMTSYIVALRSQSGKTLDVVITMRDKGTCTVLVYYADGTLRYDFSLYG